MIGKLKGIVDEVGTQTAIIDVGGVGYLVHAPSTTLLALRQGEPATLHVETVLREDMLRLYAFATAVEIEWFRLLQTVQGVGAKVALTLLATLSGPEIAAAAATNDAKAFARASGVGPRLGARIAAELKGKVPEHLAATEAAAVAPGADPAVVAEVISALSNLGYGRAEAEAAVRKAVAEAGVEASVQLLVRLSLKAASQR